MSSDIQAVYFMQGDGWTPTLARAWLKAHDLAPIKAVHKKGDELRYRIRGPRPFRRFITKIVPGGVHLVVGFY